MSYIYAIYIFNDYFIFLALFTLAVLLSFILFIASYFLGNKIAYREKLSSYECGFAPFKDAREKFDIRFYLVAILFIVFDLEVSFLFPWSIVLNDVGFFGYLSMYFFLFILTIGFVFEWFNGALDWD